MENMIEEFMNQLNRQNFNKAAWKGKHTINHSYKTRTGPGAGLVRVSQNTGECKKLVKPGRPG